MFAGGASPSTDGLERVVPFVVRERPRLEWLKGPVMSHFSSASPGAAASRLRRGGRSPPQ
ncbi:hypothetical protein BCAR13_100189 [Paraburkholderia caribensis]|nr:hypothetical protein BCAR13_100189 [Paraburkholderia caribensis]